MDAAPATGTRATRIAPALLAVLAALSHLFVPTLVIAAIEPVVNTGIGVGGLTSYFIRLGTSPWIIPSLLLFDVCVWALFAIAARRRPGLAYMPAIIFASVTVLVPLLAYSSAR